MTDRTTPRPVFVRWSILALGLIVTACGEASTPDAASAARPSIAEAKFAAGVPTSRWFTNVASAVGLSWRQDNGASASKLMPESMGCGAAVRDFDGDGRLDVYLLTAHQLPYSEASARPNQLFIQGVDGQFLKSKTADDSTRMDFSVGVAVGDVDGDGDDDMFLANLGPNRLLINDGKGRFTQKAMTGAGGNDDWSVSAIFYDHDRDGDLDLFVVNYVKWSMETNVECKTGGELSYCSPLVYPAAHCRFYRNKGKGDFVDETQSVGLEAYSMKGLGVSITDFDSDGWPDVYVTSDRTANLMLRNQVGGRFEEVGLLTGTALSESGVAEAGMGVDVGDLNGDGRPDLFVTNFSSETNAAYFNLGDSIFEERSREVGLGGPSRRFVGFGTRIFDYENDGDADIFVTNGHVLDNAAEVEEGSSYAQRDMLFINDGEGRFDDVFAQGTPWSDHVGRGLASGDFDNDGDLDLLVTNCGQAPLLLRNDQAADNAWVGLSVGGPSQGAMARVEVQFGEESQVLMANPPGSIYSAHDPRLVFGLGAYRGQVTVTVTWSDGRRVKRDGLEVNAYYRLSPSD